MPVIVLKVEHVPSEGGLIRDDIEAGCGLVPLIVCQMMHVPLPPPLLLLVVVLAGVYV